MLRLVARLDGFIGRRSDGEPGMKTIWLGLQDVRVSAATLAALRCQRVVYNDMDISMILVKDWHMTLS